jgi:hypothetical protein
MRVRATLAELERLFGMLAELNMLECDDAFPGSVESGAGAPACFQIFHALLEDAGHEAVIEVQTVVTKTLSGKCMLRTPRSSWACLTRPC